MDDPNITMEEYIRLEEEKAHRCGKVYKWESAIYGKIWDDEDVHNLRSVKTEFPAIVFNDTLTSEVTLSCEPMISPLNDNKIDFRISFDKSDDEDYTVIYDKNSFSYEIISVDDLKTDSKNDNDKVNMPSFPSPEPKVSYFNDLDYFKDFEKEFPAIVYNDALTSKLDFLTEPTVSPHHIDEFELKNETSLSECDEEEQNVLYFNDLFPFDIIYPDDSNRIRRMIMGKSILNNLWGIYLSYRYLMNQYGVSWGMDTAYRFHVNENDDVGGMIMDIHYSLKEGDDTRVNLNELSSIMRSFKGTIEGLQQDTTVRVRPNPNSGFVDSMIEGHGDGDQCKALIMSGSARVSRDEGFANSKNTDHELGGPTFVPKLTLQNPKSVPSTYDSGWTALMDLKSATPDLDGDSVITKPSEVSPSGPIVKSVDIYEKLRSFVEAAGVSAKDQPKVNSNFRSLVVDPVFDGVNIFIPRKVVEKVNSEADLVDVVTIGVPSLTGDDFTRETIRVEYEWRPPRCDVCKIFGHLHDHCPKKAASPPIVSTLNVVTPTIKKTNDGFQTVGKKKKRKGKSKSTNGAQFTGPSVKQNVRYKPKAATSVPKKGVTNVGNPSNLSSKLRNTGTSFNKDNITSPNSFSALNIDDGEEEEVVENVYDETTNIFPNTKPVEVLLSRLLLASMFH
ncbi:hypothetical protein Tco_0775394 [Tanacetum coccineum]